MNISSLRKDTCISMLCCFPKKFQVQASRGFPGKHTLDPASPQLRRDWGKAILFSGVSFAFGKSDTFFAPRRAKEEQFAGLIRDVH
jgi:hypothetical protein